MLEAHDYADPIANGRFIRVKNAEVRPLIAWGNFLPSASAVYLSQLEHTWAERIAPLASKVRVRLPPNSFLGATLLRGTYGSVRPLVSLDSSAKTLARIKHDEVMWTSASSQSSTQLHHLGPSWPSDAFWMNEAEQKKKQKTSKSAKKRRFNAAGAIFST